MYTQKKAHWKDKVTEGEHQKQAVDHQQTPLTMNEARPVHDNQSAEQGRAASAAHSRSRPWGIPIIHLQTSNDYQTGGEMWLLDASVDPNVAITVFWVPREIQMELWCGLCLLGAQEKGPYGLMSMRKSKNPKKTSKEKEMQAWHWETVKFPLDPWVSAEGGRVTSHVRAEVCWPLAASPTGPG